VKVAFTICSNNYLAQALVFVNSVKLYSPEVKIIVGLCDDYSTEIEYDSIQGCEFISLKEMNLSNLMHLSNKYNIIELNTSIKATLFKKIIQKYPEAEAVCYFDPDIKIYSSLDVLYNKLKTATIIVTPHSLNPIPLDELEPREYLFQLYGLFNLGFLGLNVKWSDATKFLDWWEERIINMATTEVEKGYFQDQRWINFVPIYYENVEIVKHRGCNVAPWNIHEREVIWHDDIANYAVDGNPLVFYHFSNYKPEYTDRFANFYNRYTPSEASNSVRKLYSDYRNELIALNIDFYRSIKPVYGRPILLVKVNENLVSKKSFQQTAKSLIVLLTPPILINLYRKFVH
jgi:hypothetical protein